MSLESWKSEFYNISAHIIEEQTRSLSKIDSDIELLDHSIKKWQGLLKANLKKHNINYIGHRSPTREEQDNGSTLDSSYFNGLTCSLCYRYAVEAKNPCKECILVEVNGEENRCGESSSPFQRSFESGNPIYILRLLKKTREHLLTKKENLKINKEETLQQLRASFYMHEDSRCDCDSEVTCLTNQIFILKKIDYSLVDFIISIFKQIKSIHNLNKQYTDVLDDLIKKINIKKV